MGEEMAQRNPEQAELLRAKVIDLYIGRKSVPAVAAACEISIELARKIIHEGLREARESRVSQVDLLLEVELQKVEGMLASLEDLIRRHPNKLKAYSTFLRVQNQRLLLDNIRVTQSNAAAVQVNVNAPGAEIDLTGATQEELEAMLQEPALEIELVRRGEGAPPMLPEGPGAG